VAGTTHDVLNARVCPEMCPVAVTKKAKTDRNLHASNWLFTQTFLVDIGPWNLDAGSFPEKSYLFQMYEKSVQGSWSSGGSKIALSHWVG